MRSNAWLHYSTGGLIINQLDRGNQFISLSICRVPCLRIRLLNLGLSIGVPLAKPPNARDVSFGFYETRLIFEA